MFEILNFKTLIKEEAKTQRCVYCDKLHKFQLHFAIFPIKDDLIWSFSIGSNKSQGCQTAFDPAETRASRESRFAEGSPWAGEEKSADVKRAGEEGRRWAQERIYWEGS